MAAKWGKKGKQADKRPVEVGTSPERISNRLDRLLIAQDNKTSRIKKTVLIKVIAIAIIFLTASMVIISKRSDNANNDSREKTELAEVSIINHLQETQEHAKKIEAAKLEPSEKFEKNARELKGRALKDNPELLEKYLETAIVAQQGKMKAESIKYAREVREFLDEHPEIKSNVPGRYFVAQKIERGEKYE